VIGQSRAGLKQLPLWDGMACEVTPLPQAITAPIPRGGLPLYRRLYGRGDVYRMASP